MLLLLLLLFFVGLLATVVFSDTAKLIIGPVQPVSTGLIAANSLSRCISSHAHMEEIKPAKLIQTPNIFLLHSLSAYTCFCVHMCSYVWDYLSQPFF